MDLAFHVERTAWRIAAARTAVFSENPAGPIAINDVTSSSEDTLQSK